MNFTIEISLEEYLTIVLLPNSVFRNLISVTFKKFLVEVWIDHYALSIKKLM